MIKNSIDTANLLKLCEKTLGDEAVIASLPEDLLKQYYHWYPQSIRVLEENNELKGFFVLVPLTYMQIQKLECSELINGFQISKDQLTDRQANWWHAQAYYLMGIYALPGYEKPIRSLFNKTVKEEGVSIIYAKGSTNRGKKWMAKKGFKSIHFASPISRLEIK